MVWFILIYSIVIQTNFPNSFVPEDIGEVIMSSIDLIILGLLKKGPMSAYELIKFADSIQIKKCRYWCWFFSSRTHADSFSS